MPAASATSYYTLKPEEPPNRRYYRQSEGIAAMFTFRRMQERQQSESGPDQEDTSQ